MSREEEKDGATPAVIVDRLAVTYPGGVEALRGVSFSVEKQEIFGLLGPNGAGKTTLLNVLTTLLRPTYGQAFLQGLNLARCRNEARMSLGYVSQDLAVDDELTGLDNLRLQAGLYHMDPTLARRRIAEVLELVDLRERAADGVATYSGGMRKRLDIACGLIHHPRILFLDEPTLGLDIQTRHEIWRYIKRLQEEVKMTILLTTHYMDEADLLCQRLAIIDRGSLKALDTPQNLKLELGGGLIVFSFAPGADGEKVREALDTLKSQPFTRELSLRDNEHFLVTTNGEEALPSFIAAIGGLGIPLQKITQKMPTLDDVFLYHTGRQLREEETTREEMARVRTSMSRLRGGRRGRGH